MSTPPPFSSDPLCPQRASAGAGWKFAALFFFMLRLGVASGEDTPATTAAAAPATSAAATTSDTIPATTAATAATADTAPATTAAAGVASEPDLRAQLDKVSAENAQLSKVLKRTQEELVATNQRLDEIKNRPAETKKADNAADVEKLRGLLDESNAAAKADLKKAAEESADLKDQLDKTKAEAAKTAEFDATKLRAMEYASKAALNSASAMIKALQDELDKAAAAAAAAPPVLTGDAAKLAQVIKNNRRRFASSAKITDVAITHNITVDNAPGMQIKVTYTANGLKDLRGMLVIWPIDDAGKTITAARDTPPALHDAAGKILTLTRFTPTLDSATFDGETLFIPYSAFPRFAKATTCKLRVVVYSGDMSNDESQYKLATDESQTFQIGGE